MPPAQEFGKRGGVFQILMPTAPTRIKLSPALLSLLPLLSLTVPLMFRNPTLRHKTAPRICLVETFLLFFLSLLSRIYRSRPFLVTF